jgi:hypothetical protein
MALWGISTNAETSANNFAIPKYLGEYSSDTSLFEAVDRNTSPYDCFADNRGWIFRHYGTTMHSGLSTSYYDEILVPVVGLNTAGAGTSTTGLGLATPIAVFFEDPNLASPISIGAGGTTGISTNTVGYVHVVWNEVVYCGAGATVLIQPYTAAGVSTGTAIVATASSATDAVQVNVPGIGQTVVRFNGQISNRVAFAFTSPSSGIGTVLRINTTPGVVGVITDASGGSAVTKTLTGLVKNIAGAGTTIGVGIGTISLTVKA